VVPLALPPLYDLPTPLRELAVRPAAPVFLRIPPRYSLFFNAFLSLRVALHLGPPLCRRSKRPHAVSYSSSIFPLHTNNDFKVFRPPSDFLFPRSCSPHHIPPLQGPSFLRQPFHQTIALLRFSDVGVLYVFFFPATPFQHILLARF